MLLVILMMENKILIDNNRLTNYEDSKILIKDNKVCFKESGNYEISYHNTNKIDIEYSLIDNIEVSIYEYLASDNNVDSKITYSLGDTSTLNVIRFMMNENLNEEVLINLNSLNAKINYHYSSLSKSNEEHHLIIRHKASKTGSNIINRVLTKEKSTIHFTIDSYQDKNSYDCDMNQETKIITDNTSNCLIKPNMYIDNNATTARHASYIGGFNEDEIFYLMSKCLTKRQAIKLLSKCFIYANINIPSVEEDIVKKVNAYWR